MKNGELLLPEATEWQHDKTCQCAKTKVQKAGKRVAIRKLPSRAAKASSKPSRTSQRTISKGHF